MRMGKYLTGAVLGLGLIACTPIQVERHYEPTRWNCKGIEDTITRQEIERRTQAGELNVLDCFIELDRARPYMVPLMGQYEK